MPGKGALGLPGSKFKSIDWQSFFTESNIPMIGYDIKTDSIIVFKGADHSAVGGSTDILHFDLKTGAWTEGSSRVENGVDVSNPVINSDGELVFAFNNSTGDFKAWNAAYSATDELEIISKTFDMGKPLVKKRLYKVTLVYKGTRAQLLSLYIQYDQSGTWITVGALEAATAYSVHEFDIPVAARQDFRDISIKIASTGNMTTAWEMTSYSLLYREKNPR